MTLARHSLRAIWCDVRGTAVIEAAFVLPILCLLTLGAFDVSRMVARNTELRSALAESAAIALALAPEDQDKARVDAIEDIVEASAGLADNQVTIVSKFRCGAATGLVNAVAACASNLTVSHYLEVTLSDTYTPHWTSFGLGSPVTLSLTRLVQIG